MDGIDTAARGGGRATNFLGLGSGRQGDQRQPKHDARTLETSVQHAAALTIQRSYWTVDDRLIANYRSLKDATNNSQHEKTLY